MQQKIFRSLILPVIISLIIVLYFSSLMQSLGDRLIAVDNFTSARFLYSLSKITNPFNLSIYERLTAANVQIIARTTESEEYADIKPLAKESSNYVLGASTQIPVLMYHYIRINPNPHDLVGFNLSVPQNTFSAQLDWLANHGYHTISLDDLGANLLYGIPLPSRPVALTFDDGYDDFFTAAYPILKKHSMKGVNFVITGFVGLPNYLSWNEISQMKNSGLITFGAHTVHHPALTSLNLNQAFEEMLQSKHDLESHLGTTINWLAYPYGSVSEKVANLAKQAGFIGAFGTQFGTFESTNTLFTQPRVRVSGGETPQSLGASLPWQ